MTNSGADRKLLDSPKGMGLSWAYKGCHAVESQRMPEFCEISSQSIWALAKHIAAIADVLKKEIPFDTLTAS